MSTSFVVESVVRSIIGVVVSSLLDSTSSSLLIASVVLLGLVSSWHLIGSSGHWPGSVNGLSSGNVSGSVGDLLGGLFNGIVSSV